MSVSLRSVLPSTSPMAALAALPTCASPYCPRPATLWQRWWARNEGVWLHQRWYCSLSCFQAGLYRRLEQAALAVPRAASPGNRLPLGLVLLSQGEITAEQLRQALDLQYKAKAGKLGEWLVRMGAVSEQQVTGALAAQQGCPVFSIQEPQWLAERFYWPDSLVRRYRAVPVFHNAARDTLYVGFLDSVDRSFLYTLEQMLRCRTDPCIIVSKIYKQQMELHTRSCEGSTVEIHERQSSVEMTRTIANYAEQVHAEHCAIACCDGRLWIRLEPARATQLDLVFRVPLAS